MCEQIDGLPYRTGTWSDPQETAQLVEALDRRIVTARADVRDPTGLAAAVEHGVNELGRLDIAAANAGIGTFPHRAHELAVDTWQQMIDINLTGVW